MEGWQVALDTFLNEWREKKDITGALVCGCFITGNPSKHSDIDVHLLLSDHLEWRERGNKVVDGYLIEYFVNPPRQVRKYFEEDYRDHSSMSMVQFLTGQVLWDRTGSISDLKQEARKWIEKPHEGQSYTVVELRKYAIWDMWDNLQNCAEWDRVDFPFVYMNSLQLLFNYYCEFLMLETIPFYQILAYLSDPGYIEKYLKKPFPDIDFATLYIEAIQVKEETEMKPLFGSLTDHVLQRIGGFKIDGWNLRSAVEAV
jgi:hypothetical protein